MAIGSVFVGSSKEGLPIAEAIVPILSLNFKVNLWTHGVFHAGNYFLEDLAAAVRGNDLALFIGSPDDWVTKRGKRSQTLRDNIIFELGMFIGALGRQRSFLFVPASIPL